MKPNLYRNSVTNIKIDNTFGEVSLDIVKEDVSDEQIDSLIDSLKLVKSISRYIKESFE